MQRSDKNKKTKSQDTLDIDLKPIEFVKPPVSAWFLAGTMIFINSKPTEAILGNLS
ncbi:MAG: hypothetical protein RMX61_02960 [Planktomarina sp.]|nr:hypothetical protein [Planktomarina sp.]|tara:strand:+ start:289 stop:456 length:168 start_codon:yes stop_codon:yes gene_type:complete